MTALPTNPSSPSPPTINSTKSSNLIYLFTHTSYFQTSAIHSLIAYITQIPTSPTRYTDINDLATIKLLLLQALRTPELFIEDVPLLQMEAFHIIRPPDKSKVILAPYIIFNQTYFPYFSTPMFAPGDTTLSKEICHVPPLYVHYAIQPSQSTYYTYSAQTTATYKGNSTSFQ